MNELRRRDLNPYESPQTTQISLPLTTDKNRSRQRILFYAWVFIFVVNLIVPLILSTQVARGNAWLGVAIAVIVLFALGCFVVAKSPRYARLIVNGGVFVATSQFFPMFQILAGMIGLGFAQIFGQVNMPPKGPVDDISIGEVYTLLGGVITTFGTAGVLLIGSLAMGLFIDFFTPATWWQWFEKKAQKNAAT